MTIRRPTINWRDISRLERGPQGIYKWLCLFQVLVSNQQYWNSSQISNFFFFCLQRSVILKRKRTDSDNCLVSEGLREAISSYLQMTECKDHFWDTWGKAFASLSETESRRSVKYCPVTAAAWANHRRRSPTPTCLCGGSWSRSETETLHQTADCFNERSTQEEVWAANTKKTVWLYLYLHVKTDNVMLFVHNRNVIVIVIILLESNLSCTLHNKCTSHTNSI